MQIVQKIMAQPWALVVTALWCFGFGLWLAWFTLEAPGLDEPGVTAPMPERLVALPDIPEGVEEDRQNRLVANEAHAPSPTVGSANEAELAPTASNATSLRESTEVFENIHLSGSMRLVRYRVAYLRCAGGELQSRPRRCPRHADFEREVWRRLEAAARCYSAEGGQGDIRIDLRENAPIEFVWRDTYPASTVRISEAEFVNCLSGRFEDLTPTLNFTRGALSFRFRLQALEPTKTTP